MRSGRVEAAEATGPDVEFGLDPRAPEGGTRGEAPSGALPGDGSRTHRGPVREPSMKGIRTGPFEAAQPTFRRIFPPIPVRRERMASTALSNGSSWTQPVVS